MSLFYIIMPRFIKYLVMQLGIRIFWYICNFSINTRYLFKKLYLFVLNFSWSVRKLLFLGIFHSSRSGWELFSFSFFFGFLVFWFVSFMHLSIFCRKLWLFWRICEVGFNGFSQLWCGTDSTEHEGKGCLFFFFFNIIIFVYFYLV